MHKRCCHEFGDQGIPSFLNNTTKWSFTVNENATGYLVKAKYLLTGPLNKVMYHKYSFHKKLGLRLATNYSWCLLNKPLHISKADTKIVIGGFQAKMRAAGVIPFLGWNTFKTPLNQRPFIHLYLAMHSAILWYCMRFCSISYDCSRYLC